MSVLKKWVVSVALLSLLAGTARARAQDEIIVWQTLSPESSATLRAAVGQPAEVRYVEAARLAEEVARAGQAGALPDILIAGHDAIEPLRASRLVAPLGAEREVFLTAWLDELPSLLELQCGDEPAHECVWRGVPGALWVPEPDGRMVERTGRWLCEATPWLASCPDATMGGRPLAWNYMVYLVSDQWLADNSIRAPRTADELFELRGKYRMTFAALEPEQLAAMTSPQPATVYIVPAAGLIDTPEITMEALVNFAAASYVPVVRLDIVQLYVNPTASPAVLDAAEELADDLDLQLALMEAARLLPAADFIALHEVDPAASLTLLRALMLLNAYANLGY